MTLAADQIMGETNSNWLILTKSPRWVEFLGNFIDVNLNFAYLEQVTSITSLITHVLLLHCTMRFFFFWSSVRGLNGNIKVDLLRRRNRPDDVMGCVRCPELTRKERWR